LAYGANLLAGFAKSLVAPARARQIVADGKPLGPAVLSLNLLTALGPLILTALTFFGIWWYVVIHQKAIEEASKPEGVQQLGTPGLTRAGPSAAELGPGDSFYWWFWGSAIFFGLILLRYYWRMDSARFVVLK